MKKTITLDRNHLWQMIQAMSLNADNKMWLGEKLINEARKEKEEKEEKTSAANPPCQFSAEERQRRLYEAEVRILQDDPGIDSEKIEEELLNEMPWLR